MINDVGKQWPFRHPLIPVVWQSYTHGILYSQFIADKEIHLIYKISMTALPKCEV